MKRVLSFIGIAIPFVISFALLLNYLAQRISPIKSAWAPAYSLSYPILLAIALLALLYYGLRRRPWAWILGLSIAIGIPMHLNFAQVNILDDSGEYRIMNYNIQNFGFYQFDRNRALRDSTLRVIKDIDADILCFQEFFRIDGHFNTYERFTEVMGEMNVHEHYTHFAHYNQRFGLCTFTRYPIIGKGVVPFEGEINNLCMYTDILLPSADTLRVFNAHLASIHFGPEDYAFVSGGYKDTKSIIPKTKRILKKLQKANRQRAIQIEEVMHAVAQSPYPTMFLGDLNAPPFSYTYHQAREQLSDAFVSEGHGFGSSYQGPFPSLRIDHIFHDEQVEVRSHEVLREGPSDHYPVVCTFDIAE